ncbi:hypothetical protein JTB14_017903 [Gonioctena quinquepunctata]|nr:hypothetical protein JTB14_017903 [Gonioctena quinquepunctata]
MEPGKKISFGFSKSSKKVPAFQNKLLPEKKVELVECFEDQSIKIKDAVEIVDEPLVIPIRGNKRNLLDRIREAKIKTEAENNGKLEDTRPDSELTLDELAARELMKDAKKRISERVSDNKVHVLPLKEDNLPLEGEKEPTLEDYEKIPINDFGLAMLRGMGWKDGMGIGKNAVNIKVAPAPELRPKGLGLGANSVVKGEISKEPVCDKNGKALTLQKGAFAKIIAGLHKGNYCEVQGLDDEACRVIVRTALKGEVLALNEFLVVPVTKEEYSKGSKVLNHAKYEEYKHNEETKAKKGMDSEKDNHRSREYHGKKEIKSESDDDYSSKHYERSKIKHDKEDRYSSKNHERKDIKSEKDDHYSRKHERRSESEKDKYYSKRDREKKEDRREKR